MIHKNRVGQIFDFNLLRGLVSFSRPFSRYFVISTVMLVFVTAMNLAQPYILKVAIDSHLNALETPMIAFPSGRAPEAGVSFHGKVFVRAAAVKGDYPEFERYQIKPYKGQYYLIAGVIPTGSDFEIVGAGESIAARDDAGREYGISLLENSDVSRFRQQDVVGVTRLGLLLLGVAGLGFVFNLGQIYFLNLAGERIVFNIRRQVFSHLQKMDVGFFDREPVGNLVTRVTNDTEKIKEFFTSVVVNLFRDFLLLIGIIVIMLKLDAKLALVSMAVLPLVALSAVLYRAKAREAFRQVRIKLADVNASIQENISGVRITKSFNREHARETEFDHRNREHYAANMQELLAFAVFRPMMDVFVALTLALLIWFGGGDVLLGGVEFGVLYAFINYADQFFRPINDLTEKYNILQSAMAASERVFSLLAETARIENKDDPITPSEFKGEIEFRNVWFAYNPGEWVLKNVSFHVSPGETVGIVGATGAGKSSLISLMLRFYDVQSGRILIDGVDVKDTDVSDLRRRLGVVLQDVFLFSGTVRDNVVMHDREISEEQVWDVLTQIGGRDFVDGLPLKLSGEVKERGASLSTGQRQILSSARVLVRRPEVIILDEATASVDTGTETQIHGAIKRSMQGRTTVIVAHRLSTVKDADEIVVLQHGEVKEVGTHQELMRANGVYWRLYHLQQVESELASGNGAFEQL